jgi:lipopolysaccharide transport system ATP-binding protein
MAETVISIENISKEYQLGLIGTGSFRGDLQRWWAKRRGLPDPHMKIGEKDHGNRDGETIWALKDVNFQVRQGEAVGIIGRNGAGKSTLLKILSRVTAPTSGEVKVKGRMASLLEVGTGFHPELTGRENIFMNGAIMGMKKAEITRKFDEIVDFSGVEKFIDTPVKRYSSGMYVRLAFSVSAHLDPEIMVVDEVLAVGDAEFQKKCLGKMGSSAGEGRTVLFVSHNMGAIQQLCSRVILLNEGKIAMDDEAGVVVGKYLTMGMTQEGERLWPDLNTAPGDDMARLRGVRVLDRNGKNCTSFDVRDPVILEMEYWVLRDLNYLDVSFYLYSERGEIIFCSVDDSFDTASRERPRPAGLYRSLCHIPGDFLNNGRISVLAGLTAERAVHTVQRDILSFTVIDQMDTSGARGNYHAGEWPPAVVRPKLVWSVDCIPLQESTKSSKPILDLVE